MKEKLTVTRRLIAQGQLTADIGEKVAEDTIVGRLDYIPGQMVRLNVADSLGIAPRYIQEKMCKDLNAWIDKNELLALNDEFYTEKTVTSPTSGYIALVSRFLGNVFIREPLPAGPKEPIIVTAEELGLSKLAFMTNCLVKAGTVVDKGRVIIGGKNPYIAPAVGKIRDVSATGGYLVIAPLYQATELTAHIKGTVAEKPDSSTMIIEGYGYRYQGVLGFGGEKVGILKALRQISEDLEAADLTESDRSKVLLVKKGVTLEALKKAEELEIKGFILGSIKAQTLKEYSHEDPLTVFGQRLDIPFTIILMQGFGSAMPDPLFESIAKHEGMLASLDGSTQLRAGVQRPQVLFPLNEELPSDYSEPPLSEGIRVGDRVILVREPYFGVSGTVLEKSAELMNTPAQTQAAMVKLKLDNGVEFLAPQQNCSKI